jgi:hypothetical protein
MPNKTSKKKRVVALPKIPKELIDQMVTDRSHRLEIGFNLSTHNASECDSAAPS